jgi:hypothetical protein
VTTPLPLPASPPASADELQVFCAWCKKQMSGPEISTRKPSHGVCPKCVPQVLAKDPEAPIALADLRRSS